MKEIEKIIKAYEATDWTMERAALGTVVKVEESSYRRIGARMYVSSIGNWTGGISGGCLEGDALKRAQIAINKNESSIVVYDTMDDDSHQIGVGLGCNGRIEVMFTPINPEDKSNPVEFLKSIVSTRETHALLQILNSSTSENLVGRFFPQAKIGDLSNLIGVQKATIENAILEARRKRKSRTFQIKNESGKEFEILVELIHPKIKVICIGDNYDVNAFVSIVHELGWEIHVCGKTRKLSRDIFQISKSVSELDGAGELPVDEHTAVILMSHDYKTDFNLLQVFINKDLPYIGLLGPRKRMLKMQAELEEDGHHIDLENRLNLHAPVGLDIGAESPEEIALSIAAEVVATIRGRDGRGLRKRQGPIHERD